MNFDIDDFFNNQWGLYKGDIERLLNAVNQAGSGSNFSASLLVLTASELFAKVYAPYVRNGRRYRLASMRRDDLRVIDAKHSARLFFRKYLAPINRRYGQFAEFIWDVFRNSHVHLFYPKKILQVPVGRIDNSFLTGSHWPGPLYKLQRNPGLLSAARSEHLTMDVSDTLTIRSGVIRPFFRFVPHVFYLDLLEAVNSFETDVRNIQFRRHLFNIGYTLLQQARRKNFPSDLPQQAQNIILKEIRDLIRNRP